MSRDPLPLETHGEGRLRSGLEGRVETVRCPDGVAALAVGSVVVPSQDIGVWLYDGLHSRKAGWLVLRALGDDGKGLFTTNQIPEQVQSWLDTGARVFPSVEAWQESRLAGGRRG